MPLLIRKGLTGEVDCTLDFIANERVTDLKKRVALESEAFTSEPFLRLLVPADGTELCDHLSLEQQGLLPLGAARPGASAPSEALSSGGSELHSSGEASTELIMLVSSVRLYEEWRIRTPNEWDADFPAHTLPTMLAGKVTLDEWQSFRCSVSQQQSGWWMVLPRRLKLVFVLSCFLVVPLLLVIAPLVLGIVMVERVLKRSVHHERSWLWSPVLVCLIFACSVAGMAFASFETSHALYILWSPSLWGASWQHLLSQQVFDEALRWSNHSPIFFLGLVVGFGSLCCLVGIPEDGATIAWREALILSACEERNALRGFICFLPKPGCDGREGGVVMRCYADGRPSAAEVGDASSATGSLDECRFTQSPADNVMD